MAEKPSGFRFVSSPIDQDGGTISGNICTTEAEARKSLVEVCEEFVRSATRGATMVYLYGEGENRHSTCAPVPEPPEGYIVVVSQGCDHHGSESEEIYAIPRGSTVVPRKGGDWLDHLHIELQGEILWVSFWEVMDVVFPPGTLEFRRAGQGYSCISPKTCTKKADWMSECFFVHVAEVSEWVSLDRRNWRRDLE